MKAISLWQPWASLMALGEKQWETRDYVRSYRGPIAIHAAQVKEHALIYSRCTPFKEALARHGIVDSCELPYGAVVAVGNLTEMVTAGDWLRRFCKTPTDRKADKEYCFGDYAPGRIAWRFEKVRRLTTPIPYTGRQGFFHLDAAAVAEIERQLHEQDQATSARRAHAVREYELFRDGSGPA